MKLTPKAPQSHVILILLDASLTPGAAQTSECPAAFSKQSKQYAFQEMRQVEHLAWAMSCGKSRHWLEELATLNVPMLYVDKSLWDPSSLGTLGVYKATYPIFFSPNCYSAMDSTALHQLHSPSGITKTNRQGRRPGKIACRACHDRKKRCDIAPPYHQCTHCRKENQCCIPRDPIERYVNEDNGILKVLHVFTNC